MANELDELDESAVSAGHDVNVIAKRIPVKTGVGSVIFEVILWVLLIIPGLIFLLRKIAADNYLQQLQQKLQHDASQIDNYLEQRVVILQNCAKLLDKAIDLDKTTMTQIAAYRGGQAPGTDEARNKVAGQIDSLSRNINLAFENYPDLEAHRQLAEAMRQNAYLQQEITAARELYNDTVNTWNRDIFAWPAKMIVAAKKGYTTRIPFSATREVKEAARGTFF